MPATDEIYEKYLQKAIVEINELGDEVARAGGGTRVPVVGSGHPLADVMLIKYRPQPRWTMSIGRSLAAVADRVERSIHSQGGTGSSATSTCTPAGRTIAPSVLMSSSGTHARWVSGRSP